MCRILALRAVLDFHSGNKEALANKVRCATLSVHLFATALTTAFINIDAKREGLSRMVCCE